MSLSSPSGAPHTLLPMQAIKVDRSLSRKVGGGLVGIMKIALNSAFNRRSTNISLQGGVDDIWWDTTTEQVIVVDYKSQANKNPVNPETYLYSTHRRWYKEQMDFYAYLLQEIGFDVSGTAYFYVCNEEGRAPGFHGKLTFEETLVSYEWSSDWIEPSVQKMIETLNSTEVPSGNASCENCAYAAQRERYSLRQS